MSPSAFSPPRGFWPVLLCVALGLAVGVGAFTFRYAEGFSYFSADPKACVNCHIMRPQYDAWLKSSHHDVAVCIDCHLPHDLVPKYLVKAENGYRHSKQFTAQTFHEPIQLTPHAFRVLQQNCVHCHADLVHDIASASRGEKDALVCTQCHARVGHGERAGLGGPLPPAVFPPSRKHE